MACVVARIACHRELPLGLGRVCVPQVQAERAAWAIAKEHGISLVTIHPAFVGGPVLSSRTDAFSINAFKVQTHLRLFP